MEFKELLLIFKKYQTIFFSVVIAFVFLGAVFFLFQPAKNVADFTLNVTRIGTQKTDAYHFDDFYRLQADERFADTVTRWLMSSPRTVVDIADEAKVARVGFSAERLSSQMIRVKYQVANKNEAQKIASATLKVLNAQTQELNRDQQEENWFVLSGGEPVTTDARLSFAKLFLASLALGVFFGFWGVLWRHYLGK